jgi:hypothetical protein
MASNLLEGKVFVKISELDPTVGFAAEDEFVLVQNGVTSKTTGLDITDSVISIGNLADKPYVDAKIIDLIAGAPGILDTLDELATALNDDANFAGTITTIVNTKLASGDFGLRFWEELAQVNTYHIAEGINLYWTQERFDTALAAKNTFHIAEGSNLYFTEQRVLDVVTPLIPTSIFDLGVPEVGIPESIPGYLYYSGTELSWRAVEDLEGFSGDYNDLTNKPTLFSGSYNDLTSKPELFSGSYNDLTNKPTDPTFTSVTATQLNVQNVAFTGTGAVTIASGNDLNFVAAGDITFNGKQLSTVATSGSYADLTNKPTLFSGSYTDLTNVNGSFGPISIAIGNNAGRYGQTDASIAIGHEAGGGSSPNSIALGYRAGYDSQDSHTIAIGTNAGKTRQGGWAIAIGNSTGSKDQGFSALAIGNSAGADDQGELAVAIGTNAGLEDQGEKSVAIGNNAGHAQQGAYAIAVGDNAGVQNQGGYAVAVGWQAGQTNQGVNSVAIGNKTGESSQGHHAIAIGHMAGNINQPNYTIILNASGATINGVGGQEASFYVAPIRDTVATTKGVFYNPTTSEVTTATLAAVATTGSYADLTNVKKEESFEITTASFNAVAGGRYGINTTSSSVTATLPATPVTGDAIFFIDVAGKFSTNNFTIARNGNTIMDLAGNLIVSSDYESFGLCWNGTAWILYQRKTLGYKTITTQTINSLQGNMSSIQSSAFNSATVAIQIRASISSSYGSFNGSGLLHYKVGSNPTAAYTDSPISPLLTSHTTAGEILTINVRPGDKIAIFANYQFSQAGGSLYITELGY